MKNLFKSVFLFVLVFVMVSSISAFAADYPTVNAWEASSRISIKGAVAPEKQGQPITIMLIKKDADPDNLTIADIGYVDQVTAGENGEYKFLARYSGNVSDYELAMYLAGENITDTLESAVTTDNLLTAKIDVVQGQVAADITVTFSNEMLAQGQTYTVIAAYYDESNKMIAMNSTQEANVSSETIQQVVNIESTYVSNAKYMKVFVWSSLETAMPLCDSYSDDLTLENPFEGDEEINVVFIGDSIYEGAGATSADTNWVTLVGEWMKDTFEDADTTVNYYNMGVSGTSTDYSLMRLHRDVIAKNPDLVFYGSSTNDSGDTTRQMESAILTLLELPEAPYIVMTHLARYDKNSAFAAFGARGKAVADHYGIPFYDSTEDMKAAIAAAGAATDDYYSDNIHPADAGYKVIADNVIDGINDGTLIKEAVLPQVTLAENSVVVNSANVISTQDESVTKTGTWKTGTSSKGKYVQATAVGDTLEFTFTGNALAFEYGLHKNSGKVEVYVDGELVLTCDPRYNDTITSYQMVCRGNSTYLDIEEDKEHTVVFKMIESTGDVADEDYLVRLFSIFTASVSRNK